MKCTMAGLTMETIYAIRGKDKTLLSIAFIATSEAKALAFSQAFGIEDAYISEMGSMYTRKESYERFVERRTGQYQTWYKGVVHNSRIGKDILFTTNESWQLDLFHKLKEESHLPLLEEWAEYIADTCLRQCCVEFVARPFGDSRPSEPVVIFGTENITSDNLRVLLVSVSEAVLQSIIQKGIMQGAIKVTDAFVNPLGINELDPYIFRFHESIGENLEKEVLHPKSGMARCRSVNGLALKQKKLFPPQADSVNGTVSAIKAGDSYIWLGCDMGTGKTAMSISAVESYFNQKWLNSHPGKTLKDCFTSKEVSYRVAIMCPSHMCAKWKREIESEVPGARGIIVTELSQLVYLREHPAKNGKEFFIFSKEIAKNDTLKRPVPTKIRYKRPVVAICADCFESSLNEENEFHRSLLAHPERVLEPGDVSGLKVKAVRFEGGKAICEQCGGHRTRRMGLNFYHSLIEDDPNQTALWEGLTCPNCDSLLMTYGKAVLRGSMSTEKFGEHVLKPHNFANKMQTNECCQVCGSALWEDDVEALSIPLHGKPVKRVAIEDDTKWVKLKCDSSFGGHIYYHKVAKKTADEGKLSIKELPYRGRPLRLLDRRVKPFWKKIKFYPNHAKARAGKMDKGGFALNGFEMDLVENSGVIKIVDGIRDKLQYVDSARTTGPRRYSLSRYCKKYLKGAFDMVIADEAHLYEGIRTEQSIALHNLTKCAKFTMLLTGTMTNGTAASLFPIHWMVNPGLLKELGYEYTSASLNRFNVMYGVIETKYEATGLGINAQGRGRQIGSSRVRPGISPMVYPDLLLDHSVMLNIGDMSNKLPPLNEYVEEVEMSPSIADGYIDLMQRVKESLYNKVGAGIVSTMLQVGVSYPDKPYGRDDIYSLKVADHLICSPKSCNEYRTELTPKEERLVEIVNRELSEGRNLFVFTEYSGKEESSVDERLKKVLEEKCGLKGSVQVVKSGDVSASKREEHIQKLSATTKVFITNYRNVETGIDFLGEYNGRRYNYPTIVFFQQGTSLASIWQASRRHYRLNQTMECRTYYLVYTGTYQKNLLSMMAKKISAAGAIQGNFSASALENMSGGIEDPTVALAKKLMAGDFGDKSTDDVAGALNAQRAIAAKASEDEELTYVGADPVTYYDVMGTDAMSSEEEEFESVFGDFLQEINTDTEVTTSKVSEEETGDVTDALEGLEEAFSFLSDFMEASKKEVTVFCTSRKKKAVVSSGQMSLF